MAEWDPDWVVAPAATLREWIETKGMGHVEFPHGATNEEAQAFVNQLRDTVASVLRLEPLTETHAEHLAMMTGISRQFWLNMEHRYRAGLAAGKTDTT